MKKKNLLVGFIVALLLVSLVMVGCSPSPKALAKQAYELEQKIDKLAKNGKNIEKLQAKHEKLLEIKDNMSKEDQEICEMEYMRLYSIGTK